MFNLVLERTLPKGQLQAAHQRPQLPCLAMTAPAACQHPSEVLAANKLDSINPMTPTVSSGETYE